MMPLVKLMRPSVVLLTALGVFVGAFVSRFSIYPTILIAMISALLIAGGGNALNDYFDYKTDRINKPKRPIPSGATKREDALFFSLILLSSGFVLSFLLNTFNILLALVNIFVIFIYNIYLKRLPLIGNLGPSWLAASSFMYGGLLSMSLSPTTVLLFSMAFLANTSREIAKSLEDIAGDMRTGYKTLPAVSGEKFSFLIASVFIFLAIAFSPLPYFFKLLNGYYITFVLVADFVFLLSLFNFMTSAKNAQRYMKIAMFISIFAFFVGAI